MHHVLAFGDTVRYHSLGEMVSQVRYHSLILLVPLGIVGAFIVRKWRHHS